MRAFSMIGLIVSLVIVGWFGASYMVAATGGDVQSVIAAPEAVNSQPGAPTPGTPINRARDLASNDKERQRMMEDLMKDQ
jgi:hypothetical protein